MSWLDKDLTFLLLNFGENKTFLLFNVTKIVLRFVLKKGNFLGWGLARFPHSNPPFILPNPLFLCEQKKVRHLLLSIQCI